MKIKTPIVFTLLVPCILTSVVVHAAQVSNRGSIQGFSVNEIQFFYGMPDNGITLNGLPNGVHLKGKALTSGLDSGPVLKGRMLKVPEKVYPSVNSKETSVSK